MDQGDLGGEPGQERGLLDGGITAADDGDLLSPIQRTVAGGTGAHAIASVWALDAQPPGRRPRGDDQGAGRVVAQRAAGGVAAGIVGCPHPEGPPGEVDLENGFPPGLGAESLGLLPHQLHQLGPINSFGKAGEIIHRGRQRELPTRLFALEYKGGQVGPRGVEGGCQAGRPGPDDHNGSMRIRHQFLGDQKSACCAHLGAAAWSFHGSIAPRARRGSSIQSTPMGKRGTGRWRWWQRPQTSYGRESGQRPEM